ncbi:G10 protein [Fragilaria crotonensis]|nr:G10 protein [Fragilaria crotonensis]
MAPRWGKKKSPPPGFDYVEPILEALENELRDKVKESNEGKRKTESLWPVHQINWQKSRYIYDLYYTYKRISRQVYDYCIDQKLVDAALIAKWKKPGYERLCSTYVINPTNYKFGTTSLCRVPLFDRSEEQRSAQDPTTGCRGCASGKGAGPRNLFGNKYGQSLAAVQIAREKRMVEIERKRKAEEERHAQDGGDDDSTDDNDEDDNNNDDGEAETDDEDDDYGPTPAAGVWAGSQKLQAESDALADNQGHEEEHLPKKQRTH